MKLDEGAGREQIKSSNIYKLYLALEKMYNLIKILYK